MRVQASVEIDRPLRDVFDYVSDVDHYPQWMAHVSAVRNETLDPDRRSGRFVVVIKSLGRRFETPYERASEDAGWSYADRAVGGPIPDHLWRSAFAETASGTVYTRTADVASRGLLKLLEPIQKRAADRQLRKDLQTLKGVLEA